MVHIFKVYKKLVVFCLAARSPLHVVDMRWMNALGQCVIAWVREVVTVGIASISLRNGVCDSVVCVHHPHSGGVSDCRHCVLLALLLLPVDNEEGQEEEDDEHQDNDPCNCSNLVRVCRYCCARPTQAV